MSLFGSLTTAVSGLNSQQDALGNISTNIANSQTIGYKGANTSFEELVTESNENYNAPGGVLAKPVYTNQLAGTLQQSSTATSMAISGNGFFQVKATPTVNTEGNSVFSTQDLYTRRGDFQLNDSGYLVNGAGFYLEGYNVNPSTKAVTSTAMAPLQFSNLTSSPTATSNVGVTANLPASYASKTIGGVANTSYTAPSPVTVQVYDAQGISHTMNIQFNRVGPDTTATPPVNGDVWTADISASGLGQSTDVPYQLTLTFSTGASGEPAAGTLMSIANSTPAATGTQTTPGGTVTVPATQTTGGSTSTALSFVTGSGSSAVTQTLDLNFGNFGSTSGLTQYAGTSVQTQSLTQDGRAQGSFQSVGIDAQGNVSLNYDNGQSAIVAQIPVAQFAAPQNLQQVNGGSWAVTTDSGNPVLNAAGASGAGTIASSELESSNVDIATEFTKMIVAQQAYSANSKVITTTDNLLQEILGLIQ